MSAPLRSSTARIYRASTKKALALTSPPVRLPPMPTIGELVKLYKLRARKQLSQNFLMDINLTNKIVKSSGHMNNNYVCEVGPGPGGISRSIINQGPKKLILIEKDRRFKPTLELLRECAPGKVDIHYGDVLSFNMSRLFPDEERKEWTDTVPNIRIVGNLPFNVATPLIVRWLKDISRKANAWEYGRVTLALTFQHEVAERLVADAADVQRCRLSVMAQYLCHVYYKFTIPGSAFVPKPDVDVGVVKFVPRKEPLIKHPFELVEKVTRQIFGFRQKNCVKGAGTLFPESLRKQLRVEMLNYAEVSLDRKPFQLTIDEFSRLCDSYEMICQKYPNVKGYNYRGHRPDEIWEELYGEKLDLGDNNNPEIENETNSVSSLIEPEAQIQPQGENTETSMKEFRP